MKTHRRRYSPTAFAVLFLLIAGLRPVAANDLQSVRTGYHRSYSRVVVQFTGPVRYWLTTNPGARTVSIKVEGIDGIRAARRVAVAPADAMLDAVRYFKDADRLTITTVLKTERFKVNDYALHWPFRIVLDIHHQDGADTGAARATAEPTSAGQPTIDSSSAPQANIPREVLKHTRPQLGLRKAVDRPRQETQRNGRDAQKKAARGPIFWLICAAFVLLDAMLLVLFLNRKKATRRKASTRQNLKRTPASRTGKHKPRATQLETSEPPPNPPEFVHLLKEALAREDASEGAQSAPARASETAPFDYSGPIPVDAPPPPDPPDFKEIALELYPELADDALTEESARQQLIGRDGVDFMKNVKRLYLN